LVVESLDLASIYASYTSTLGKPPHNPQLMLSLLLYSYCRGLFSSRKIAQACDERIDYKAILGSAAAPDFRCIGGFRKRHFKSLGNLFTQVLELCRQAGMVKLGHVAIDGTKIRANASKHKAMSYGRMNQISRRLRQEVDNWLASAKAVDESEDQEFGSENSGQEMPEWCRSKQERIKRIRQAKKDLEERAKRNNDDDNDEDAPPSKPKNSDQINFTDPESRIMPTKDGFQQCYNAQAAVDAESQIIVALSVTDQTNDKTQLVPMLDEVKASNGRNPDEVSADNGYCSEVNLKAISRRRINGYVATGRQKHGEKTATGPSKQSRVAAMTRKLKMGGFRSRYRLRKQTVEPVFGQIKQGRGFRQFLTRGLKNVRGEWELICISHNILKLAARMT
jgi:transposase